MEIPSGFVIAMGEYLFVVIGISLKEKDDITAPAGRVIIGNGGITFDETVF